MQGFGGCQALRFSASSMSLGGLGAELREPMSDRSVAANTTITQFLLAPPKMLPQKCQTPLMRLNPKQPANFSTIPSHYLASAVRGLDTKFSSTPRCLKRSHPAERRRFAQAVVQFLVRFSRVHSLGQ